MVAPLAGIRVIEVANWLAAPAATALMADLGADVIKVEPPGGDVLRHFDMVAYGYTEYRFPTNCVFELDNRGKRSIVVDLDRSGGPELVHRLLERADVLVLNLTPKRRERYRLTEDAVRATRPSIVYASLTGYGTAGPDADRPGFDYAAFWARAGIMNALGSPPPLCRGGQGDHATSLNLLAAVLAALRVRDSTGAGQAVEVTLQGTGMWTVASDLSAALLTRQQAPRHDRVEPSNPIWNSYLSRDGRWILLVMPAPVLYWPRFCRAIGEPAWADDPRYSDMAKRKTASLELTAAIADRFAQRDLAEWAQRLDAEGLIWAPVVDFVEVIDDPQPRRMGAFATLEHPQAGSFETLAAPFTLRDADVRPRGAAPATGEHSRAVLEELGLAEAEIAALEAAKVLG
jgi:crotonobetainyl-CoA:carnitine CoA-transferase CaiB-like acyl-CoA transferase